MRQPNYCRSQRQAKITKRKKKNILISTQENKTPSTQKHQTIKTDLLECNGRENLKPEGIIEKNTIQFNLYRKSHCL